jgi:predicted nucleotidyltransferase
MLSSFLFTPKQQRLLASVLLRPDREFTFSELLESAEGGTSSVQHYLRTLTDSGVLKVRQHRRSKLYRANEAHPLYPELYSIAVKSFAVAEPIARALAPYAGRIERAFVFGSIAQGSARHDSDVDVMVIGSVRVGEVAAAMRAVEEALGRKVHVNVYEPREWQSLSGSDAVVKAIAEGPKIELDLTQSTAS